MTAQALSPAMAALGYDETILSMQHLSGYHEIFPGTEFTWTGAEASPKRHLHADGRFTNDSFDVGEELTHVEHFLRDFNGSRYQNLAVYAFALICLDNGFRGDVGYEGSSAEFIGEWLEGYDELDIDAVFDGSLSNPGSIDGELQQLVGGL